MTNSLSGLSISAGKYNFLDCSSSAREEARWSAVIDELELYGLIKANSYKRQLFSITDTGYKVADELKEKLGVDTSKEPDEYLES